MNVFVIMSLYLFTDFIILFTIFIEFKLCLKILGLLQWCQHVRMSATKVMSLHHDIVDDRSQSLDEIDHIKFENSTLN